MAIVLSEETFIEKSNSNDNPYHCSIPCRYFACEIEAMEWLKKKTPPLIA